MLVVPRPDRPAGSERWVVREYVRGGALAGLMGDRYVRLGTPRPVREFRLARALEALGIPTPAAVGAATYPRGPWYRGELVTEWVPGSADLARILFGRAALGDAAAGAPAPPVCDPALAMRAAGRLVAVLHEAGVRHPDLNIKNILVEAGPGFPRALVLDLDRACLVGRLSGRARRRMLERFERSLRKWERRTGTAIPPSLRAAFLGGYGDPGPEALRR
ncbi:MAG TPA: lipopolysaccharide kinase InaA family protein [Longimicrobiales bacterium]|nr:lipopolysaccharide kinase InaA family protein [Longimicrobiales bacterium]